MNNLKTRLELDKILESIASNAAFSLGKQRVLNTEPSFSNLIVKRELDRLSDAMKIIEEYDILSFGGIKDVSFALDRASKGAVLGIEEIVHIGQFINGINRLKSQYDNFEIKYEHLNDLFSSLVPTEKLAQVIAKAFGDNFEVLNTASSELREIRRKLSSLKSQIDRETQSFLNKNKDILAENLVTLHHGRQTFLIKPGDKNKLDGNVLGSSGSGQSLYFEPEFLNRLQNELQNTIHQEQAEIERICRVTSIEIGKDADQLLANLDTASILDAIFAKAIWGVRHEGVVAKMSDAGFLFKDARHPLIESDKVITNTYTLKPPHKMILISGPNTGGKSVTLKTFGLFTALTLCGCPVFASEAEVQMVDNIFVDIGDQQSIEKSLSSFSAHLETVSLITKKATSKSLILLDELGSQTDPLEGESLSMALLDHFRSLDAFVIATTHFSKLKKYGTQYDTILNASVEFDLESLRPTYKYKENVLGESNALHIARELGLAESIIEAAENYKKESTFEEDHLLEILNKRIQEAEHLKQAIEEEKQELEQKIELNKEAHKKLIASIKKEKEDFIKAQEESFEIKLKELEAKIKDLDQQTTPTKRHELKQEVEKLRPEPIIEKINVGDTVRIKQSSQVGIVEKIEKNIAFVSVGTLSMQVKLKDLSYMAKPKKQKKTKTYQVSRPSSISLECNVIGKRVTEAIPIVDKYIDECILRNMHSCRIVHGVGTGQLRNALHEHLRRHKQVKSFSLAAINEGGAGATRVVLR